MPYSEAFGDFYYSRADGRAECRHVFLGGNGLPERFEKSARFIIGELGFGTGLNFIETWAVWADAAPQGAVLEFHSFELHPLERAAMVRALSAWPELCSRAEILAAAWPDRPSGEIVCHFDHQPGTVELTVHCGPAQQKLPACGITADAWYLDGFAPSRNPEMWSAELLRAVAASTTAGGTCATYSAAGWVRRNLAAAGFSVEKRSGHAGKRDMSVGVLSR